MPINVFGGLWGQSELTADHGLSPVRAETAISMIFWGMAGGPMLAVWLSDRIGHRKWVIVFGAVAAAAAFSAAIYSSSTSALFQLVTLFAGGLFVGAQMLVSTMAKEGQSSAASGTVIAFVNMIGIGGDPVFQPLVGTLIDLSDGAFAMRC